MPLQQNLLQLFKEYPHLAVIISLIASILIAVIGVLPSVFLTAANIVFFGFWNGTFISFLGEAFGAAIAFLLYRKGLKQRVEKGLQKYPKLKKLTEANNTDAFYLIFSLRLIPFVPSGLVTLAAAVGKASFLLFLVASSLGKLPALFMEAYAVYEIIECNWQGKLILVMVGLGLIYGLFKKINDV